MAVAEKLTKHFLFSENFEFLQNFENWHFWKINRWFGSFLYATKKTNKTAFLGYGNISIYKHIAHLTLLTSFINRSHILLLYFALYAGIFHFDFTTTIL